MRTPLLVVLLAAAPTLAGPPMVTQVSLRQAEALLARRVVLTPAEAESRVLLGLLIEGFGLDEVSLPPGTTAQTLGAAPDLLLTRVLWEAWATCNRLTPAQQQVVARTLPRLEAKRRPVLVAWAQLNTGAVAEGRAGLGARLLELLRPPARYDTLREAHQVLSCVGPHLPPAEVAQRRKALEALAATLPPQPPG